jgi:hypothetical protein
VGGEGEGAAGGGGLLWEVLKAADMLQAEGLLKHCLEAFRGGLTVQTAIEHLVWAHTHGPEEARRLAMAYVVQHIKTIQVFGLLVNVMLFCGTRCSLTDSRSWQREARESTDLLKTLPADVSVQMFLELAQA